MFLVAFSEHNSLYAWDLRRINMALFFHKDWRNAKWLVELWKLVDQKEAIMTSALWISCVSGPTMEVQQRIKVQLWPTVHLMVAAVVP